jgi:hypothetical protein
MHAIENFQLVVKAYDVLTVELLVIVVLFFLRICLFYYPAC